MGIKSLAIALALASTAIAAPTPQQSADKCQDAYKACVAAGTPEVACACTLTACVGEDNARNREFCSSATASLVKPTSTGNGIPGGCNPAHPGSCPSSYFTYTTETPVVTKTFTSIYGIPGGCNPAHPGSCPTPTSGASASFTPIPGIPGGCNPAHPGSCPSSYFTYPTLSATGTPATTPSAGSGSGAGAPAAYPNPKPVEGKTWTIADLTRYCGEDNSGCDYNFVIKAGDKTERCTVVRMPGSNAATESWSDQPCTSGSKFKISWGYVTEPAPAFAVVTVVNDKEIAWFGVSNVNEQPVTPSNPFGSGQYGDLPSQQVYTY